MVWRFNKSQHRHSETTLPLGRLRQICLKNIDVPQKILSHRESRSSRRLAPHSQDLARPTTIPFCSRASPTSQLSFVLGTTVTSTRFSQKR